MTEQNTDLSVVGEFDGISFLSKIEKADTLQKKVKIFNDALNQEPIMPKNLKAEMIKKGLSAGSAQDFDYLPVGIVEEGLRQIFFRQVDFEIISHNRDLNSYIVHSRISYKCPISLEYRKIDGIGAAKLQQDANSKIFDFNSTMKANALELGVGIAYSRSIKNAAKKLGKLFGANLNRDEELENITVFSKSIVDPESVFNEICGWFETKKDKVPANEFENIRRVIDNKEQKSYSKVHKLLKAL